MTAPGASTPATSGTQTDTSGKSSGTPGGHQSQTDVTFPAATKRALRDDHGEHGKGGQRPECSTRGFSPRVVIALTAVRCRACRSPHPGSGAAVIDGLGAQFVVAGFVALDLA